MGEARVPASAPVVAVIIPTHNRRDLLLRCLEHVHSLREVAFRTIVVFDGCVDGSWESVRDRFPGTVAVEGDGNLWWSGSINAGIRVAQRLGVRYVCLLNDDVRPDPDMLAALLRAANEFPGALIGSKIYHMNEPTRIWCAGGLTNWLGSGAVMRGNGETDGPAWGAPAEVDWLPGMGTLIPMSVIDRIGGMDTRRFPQYFGDADFSLRARQASIPILVCPEAKLFNDVASTGELLPAGSITLRTAITLLGSRRSHASVRPRLQFWLRHCPLPLIPWQMARFYGPLLAAIVKKLTWDRRFRPSVLRRPASP